MIEHAGGKVATMVEELTEQATELAFPAMKQLRPHLNSLSDFLDQVGLQRTQGYRLVGSFDANKTVVAVAGFRVMHSLASGRYLNVDDLSTLPSARRQGHASALLRWIDDEARRLGCGEVQLISRTHRHDAHRRYLSSGYIIPAFHFSKSIGGQEYGDQPSR